MLIRQTDSPYIQLCKIYCRKSLDSFLELTASVPGIDSPEVTLSDPVAVDRTLTSNDQVTRIQANSLLSIFNVCVDRDVVYLLVDSDVTISRAALIFW